MLEHVKQFIKFCPCCQKMDQMKKVIHAYPFTTSSYGLFDTVSMDFIEGLLVDDYGHANIAVMTDNFSRFTVLFPSKKLKAEAATDAILHFTGHYPTPAKLQTDRGAAFTSNLMKSTLERLGIRHCETAPYSKEQNAIVERQNKEVMRHLRNIIFDKRVARKWSSCGVHTRHSRYIHHVFTCLSKIRVSIGFSIENHTLPEPFHRLS